jgi:hypothetical protein
MHAATRFRKTAIAGMFVALLFCVHPAFWSASAWARPQGGDRRKPAKLFATDAADATLALTLAAPWREFERTKSAKKRYPGTLEYVDESGTRRSVPVAFQPRGINRLEVCRLPPVKLIFEKDAVKDTPFRGNKSLKLVTHCGNGDRWEHYAIKEMLAYRIYSLVSERSFRVRAVSATYVDSAERSSDGPHFGFLIEDDSDLAKRNHLQRLRVPRLEVEQLEPLDNDRFSLFEYLIGNTDFAVLNGPSADRCCHNSELFVANAQSKVSAVPYDFDSSGLVDAHYAVPSPTLMIRSNRERVYRGFCANNAMLETARHEMIGLEPRILELVRNEGRLDARSRQAADDYLSNGFEVLRDDEKFAREITAKCRK